MSDITANLVVGMPAQLFTLASSFKANANGKIFIGVPDTDPTIPSNQIQVYVENEDGSLVPVSQPIAINAGGFPVLSGQISKFVTVQNYSMVIQDAYGAQQFYFEDVAKYDPDQLRQQLEQKKSDGTFISELTYKIGLPASISGAVLITLQKYLDGVPSVKSFNAKGDGSTDDTAAFNAASAAYPDGVYVPAGRYVIPSNINGKFWGPGRRIFAAGDTVSVPFANTGQSLANLIWGYDAGKIYSGSDTEGQVVLLGPSAGRNVSTGTNITAVGVGTLSGDTLVDALFAQ